MALVLQTCWSCKIVTTVLMPSTSRGSYEHLCVYLYVCTHIQEKNMIKKNKTRGLSKDIYRDIAQTSLQPSNFPPTQRDHSLEEVKTWQPTSGHRDNKTIPIEKKKKNTLKMLTPKILSFLLQTVPLVLSPPQHPALLQWPGRQGPVVNG